MGVAWLVFGWSHPAFPVEQPHLQLAPINLNTFANGNIGYSYQRNTWGTSKTSQQTLGVGVNVGIQAQTYIWQPWIARLNGYLGISTAASTGTSNTDGSTAPAIQSESATIMGGAALNVLQRSRFPFRATVYRTNNKDAGFFSGINSGQLTQGYSLNQTYRSLNGKHDSAAIYSQSTGGRAGYDVETADKQLNLSLTSQLTSSQAFQMSNNITILDRPIIGDHFLSNTLVANHNYLPNTELSVGSVVNTMKTSHTSTPLIGTGSQNDYNSQQFYSFASWRPEDNPLTMTSSVRLLKSNSSSNGVAGAQVGNSNFNLGANYAWSGLLRTYGSVNVNDNNGIQSVTTNAAISAQKAFGERQATNLGGFRYTQFTGATLSNQTSSTTDSNQITTTSSGQALGLALGHGLDNSTEFGGGRLTTNLNQGLSTALSTVSTPITHLTTGGSLSWNHAESTGTTTSRLSVNDSRNLSGKQNFFQIINLQTSRNEKMGRNQSLVGNLTMQASRSGTSEASSPFVATPSADLNYHHPRLFQVKNLEFDSILRIQGAEIVLAESLAAQSQASVSWDNNLDYFIGLLKLRLATHLAEVNKVAQSSLVFTMNRTF